MPVIAAALVIGCVALALRIWHRRQGRERTAEFDEALARVREELPWRRVVLPVAVLVELVLIAALVRNPSRWALLLVALAAIGGGVTVFLVRERRRRAADH